MKSIFTKTAMFLAILLALTFGALGTIPAQARSFSYGVTTPTYYPFGPQANVDQSALTGWQACWTSDYSSTVSLDSILAACNGDYLLLAGGPSASTVFDVLAAAPRSDVLFDTGTGNTPHDANGSGWYYNSSWSWGFAPTGDVIDRNSCDVAAVYDGAGDQNLRLCWHTYSNNVNPGWSSGTNTSEFDPTYRRVIYQPSTTQTVTYDGNGSTSGSVPVDASSPYTPGATVTVLDNTGSLAKTGYTFSGWSTTDVEGGSESTYLGSDTFTMPGNGVTLYAIWTANQYTITFDSAGGSSVSDITQDYDSAVTPPADPTKAGYTFAGWDPSVPATMPLDGASLTAQWTINQYTITFDSAGGSSVADITQDYNSAVTAPADPTKTGYVFAGWIPAFPATMPLDGDSLTAQWTANSYTITFDSAGGTPVASITQDYNSAVTAPADPTKAGYTFAGWNPAVPATMPLDGASLTAQWTINQYTITFDSAGGSSVASITQDYGSAVTAPADPTKTGYTFAGWNPAVPATMPLSGASLTAQWTINQYTITFNSAGGTSVASITQDYGSAVTAPADPTKTGYTFAGWSPAVPATMPLGGASLTAQWTANQYTITFDSAGGTPVASITQAYGSAVTAPAAPTKTGYTFAGWNPPVPATMPLGGASLTAQWTISTYTLTYTAGTHGSISGTSPQTVDYGANGTAVTAVAASGYHFVNWSDSSTANPRTDNHVTANISVTANFALNGKQLLRNGGFNVYVGPSVIPQYWTAQGFASKDGKNTANVEEGLASVQIGSHQPSVSKVLSQTILFKGLMSDALTFSFWVKGLAIPVGKCSGSVLFYNEPPKSGPGTPLKLVDTETIKCPTGTFAFKPLSISFVAPSDYVQVVVKFTFAEPSGTVWFDFSSLLLTQ